MDEYVVINSDDLPFKVDEEKRKYRNKKENIKENLRIDIDDGEIIHGTDVDGLLNGPFKRDDLVSLLKNTSNFKLLFLTDDGCVDQDIVVPKNYRGEKVLTFLKYFLEQREEVLQVRGFYYLLRCNGIDV